MTKEDLFYAVGGLAFLIALAAVTIVAFMRPWQRLRLWAVPLLGLGVTEAVAIASEGGIRVLVIGTVSGMLWARAAEQARKRQELTPAWLLLVGALLGGILLVVPLWQRGDEWRSQRTKVIGWVLFWAVLAYLWGMVFRGLQEGLS